MNGIHPIAHLLRLGRDTAGTAALEFGFIAIILISIVMGTMEVGRFMWLEHMVENAAKQGARFATVRGEDSSIAATDAQITAYVADRVTGLTQADMTVNVVWDPDKKRGSTVTVSIATIVSPMAAGFLPFEAYTVAGTSSLIIAQ